MEVIKKDFKEKRIKIILGKNIKGKANFQSPTKTIFVRDATLNEVYNKILEVLNEQ